MPQSIFLDLDGTLTDPKLGITRCIQHALQALGEPVPETDTLTWCIGPPLLDSFEQLVGARRAPEAVAHYRARFADTGLFENALYPGIPDSLAQLQAAGCRLYLATSKPLVFARRIVEHFALDPYFDDLFGSELDGTRSHKADLLEHALTVSGADLAQSIMVGDRQHDMLGARAVGMLGVGVLYGYGDAQELSQHGAHTLLETPEELPQLRSLR